MCRVRHALQGEHCPVPPTWLGVGGACGSGGGGKSPGVGCTGHWWCVWNGRGRLSWELSPHGPCGMWPGAHTPALHLAPATLKLDSPAITHPFSYTPTVFVEKNKGIKSNTMV